MTMRQKIKPRRMHEQVVEVLIEEIHRGTLAIGSELPSERELSEEFGVSRLTVREAIGSLERSGLIEVRAGTRARVSLPDSDRLIHLLSGAAALYLSLPDGLRIFQEARAVIEVGITRLAAERIDADGLAALEKVLERNRADIGDLMQFTQSDVDFHVAIAEIVGNDILTSFYRAAGLWLRDTRHVTLAAPEQMETAFAAHARIFEAIRNGHAERAGQEMSDHLDQVNKVYAEQTSTEASPVTSVTGDA